MTWKKTVIADSPVLEIELPEKLKPNQRQAIAQEVIDFIVDRTQKGKDVKGNKWEGLRGEYTPEYQKSLDFKIAGKSKKKVDLTLSSEMLNDLEIIKQAKGKIVIGYGRGNNSRGKAEGNILGTYGQPTPRRGKSRPFLGITGKDLAEIVDPYLGESDEA